MNNEEILCRINECENEMWKTYEQLKETISNCEENKARLGSNFSLDIMGDYFFPENKQKIKFCKKSIQDFIDLLHQSKQQVNKNQTNLAHIKTLIIRSQRSQRSQRSIPLFLRHVNIRFESTIPAPFKGSSFPLTVLKFGTFIGIAITSIVCVIGDGLGAIFAFAIIEQILMVTTVMMRGYERKRYFEKSKKIYEKNIKEVRGKVDKPLEEINQQLTWWLFFISFKFLFICAGLVVVGVAMIGLLS